MPEGWSTITKSKIETPFNLDNFDVHTTFSQFWCCPGARSISTRTRRGVCLVQECKILSTFRVKNVYLGVGKWSKKTTIIPRGY